MTGGTVTAEVTVFERFRDQLQEAFRTSNLQPLRELDPQAEAILRKGLGYELLEALKSGQEISTDMLNKHIDLTNRKINGIRHEQKLKRFR